MKQIIVDCCNSCPACRASSIGSYCFYDSNDLKDFDIIPADCPLSDAPEADGWIRVEDQKPPVTTMPDDLNSDLFQTKILVCDEEGEQYVYKRSWEDSIDHVIDGFYKDCQIKGYTHWRTLPAPPKTKQP
jgi:hypothetical protein